MKKSTSLKNLKDNFREKQLNLIISDDQPFTLVENKFYRELLKFLNPSIDKYIIGADTLKNDLTISFEKNNLILLNSLKVVLKIKVIFPFLIKILYLYRKYQVKYQFQLIFGQVQIIYLLWH